ncbi:MAG TPA: type IV pilus twitching motility protein PilT [Gemmatimonadales bacterium]|nr:type IV pilus twitching motility protein PilT [Gemmatimonadales bacterium]
MARLDRFIQVLHEHAADGLQLAAGKPATLIVRGTLRPIMKEPLTGPQVFGLVQEIAPPGMAPVLTPKAELTFSYVSPSGAVEVELRPDSGGPGATIRRKAGAAAATPAAAPMARELSGARASLERLLRALVIAEGSDLHLRTGQPPIHRMSGTLVRLDAPALEAGPLEAMLRSAMSDADFAKWAEEGDADWAFEIGGVARFRCNSGRDRFGPMAVFRVIPSEVLTCEQLGVTKEVQALCHLTKGLVVVTGPTGCGKSTTLAALVDLMNRTRTDHIITIEDPVEFVHESKQCLVTQRQVGLHTRSFKQALRAALREDPDIILVGEMRDLETVSIAIETAETGHLVFGTLHTTTAVSTIDRIIDQFPTDRQAQVRVMLSESLRGVIAQVLCKKKGGGRVAAREVLLTIPAVSNLIREGKSFQIPSIMQTNRKLGMLTLNDSLLDLVEHGLIEAKEAYLKSSDKTALITSLKAKRVDTSFLGEG